MVDASLSCVIKGNVSPRRYSCHGDCGRWWYYEGKGRPVEWCPRCYRIHKAALNRELRQFYADRGIVKEGKGTTETEGE